ncbi:MAG TPA: AAA family ATPase [Candidatus Limiplasma sp.]|nr:AAA family ATPase [Candidatus Limiplasma sp.]
MFRYLSLKNYKSLVNIRVDFTKTRDIPRKLIMIYGENGIGKTNLASSFLTLRDTLETKYAIEEADKILASFPKTISNEDKEEIYNQIMRYRTLENIIKNAKTINSSGNMRLEFGFRLKGYAGVYLLETNETEVVHEKLEYVYKKNKAVFFDISPENIILNNNVFPDVEYRQSFKKMLEEYWGKHTLLALLLFDAREKAKGYIEKRIARNLDIFMDFLYSTSIETRESRRENRSVLYVGGNRLLRNIEEGSVAINDEVEIIKTENMLNEFFTSLYSDIKQVYYEREKENNQIRYKLFFRKLIFGELRDIEYSKESTGTVKLIELLPYFIQGLNKGVVVIDEMDSGIHDLMIEAVLESLYPYITGQMIITTHNTQFLESSLAKDSVYIFHVDAEANKELIPIRDFELRMHPNLNLRKRYLSGLYGGIPNTMEVDFSEMTSHNVKGDEK